MPRTKNQIARQKAATKAKRIEQGKKRWKLAVKKRKAKLALELLKKQQEEEQWRQHKLLLEEQQREKEEREKKAMEKARKKHAANQRVRKVLDEAASNVLKLWGEAHPEEAKERARKPARNKTLTYDLKYDKEVNQLLDEVKEVFLWDDLERPLENYDFPEDTHHVGPIPDWYQEMLQSKIKETKRRLENLSSTVCDASPSTATYIKKIEEDHGTTFCKMDYPKHAPMNMSWTNVWTFYGTIHCKDMDNDLNHAHTVDCRSFVMKNEAIKDIAVPAKMSNFTQNDYSQPAIDAVKLFQDFAMEIIRETSLCGCIKKVNEIYNILSTVKWFIRSNNMNDFTIIVYGKKMTQWMPRLKKFFESGPGKDSGVRYVFYFTPGWSKNQRKKDGMLITGTLGLKDKIGPISIQYDVGNHRYRFNSVETMQLGKIIQDYMGLTSETTLLDLGCDIGVLSLIMAYKCEKVVGLDVITMNAVRNPINEAERLKKFNKIHNVTFVKCNPQDVLTACSALIEECTTVAILNLASSYGKSRHVIQALRDIPSIWRVIIYGSFTDEFHKNIAVLTSEDNTMGERYLPIRGCILDKSPTVVNAFNIVVLFERKSPIARKVKLLEPDSALNVTLGSDAHEHVSLNAPEKQSTLPFFRNQVVANSKIKKEDNELSNLSMDNGIPSIHIKSEFTDPNSTVGFLEANCQNMDLPVTLKNEPEDMEISSNSPDIYNMETPIHNSRALSTRSPLSAASTKVVVDEFEFPLQVNLSYLLSSKRDSGNNLLDASQIKKEKDTNESYLTIPELVNDGVSGVVIKSKIVDPNCSASSSAVNCENVPVPLTIKSEPVDSHETLSVYVKNENGDIEIAPNFPDIENMETPVHNPRAFKGSTSISLLANTVNDFEFPVQPNLSYLTNKRDLEQPNVPAIFKTKPVKEITIIDEKKRKLKHSQPKIRLKTLNSETTEEEDLRTLYEQRQAILRELSREGEERPTSDSTRAYKRQLSSSSSPRKHNRSPSPVDYKHKRSRRSPSPKRSRRSPSPYRSHRRRSPISPD